MEVVVVLEVQEYWARPVVPVVMKEEIVDEGVWVVVEVGLKSDVSWLVELGVMLIDLRIGSIRILGVRVVIFAAL